jgi:hypothetical protein
MLLLDNTENILFRTRLSWDVLIFPGLITMVGLCCAGFTILAYMGEPPPGDEVQYAKMLNAFGNCSTCIVAIGLMISVWALINYMASEVILTDRRLVKKTLGSQTEIFLDKVDSLAVEGSTLVVFSTGGSAQKFKHLSGAEVLRYQLAQQIEKRSMRRR